MQKKHYLSPPKRSDILSDAKNDGQKKIFSDLTNSIKPYFDLQCCKEMWNRLPSKSGGQAPGYDPNWYSVLQTIAEIPY